LYPVAHILDFETSHDTGKAGTEFFPRADTALSIHPLCRDVKGRLRDLCAFPCAGP